MSASALRGQKKVLDPLELELQVVVRPPEVHSKTQTRSSAGAVLALSSYLAFFLFLCLFKTAEVDVGCFPYLPSTLLMRQSLSLEQSSLV